MVSIRQWEHSRWRLLKFALIAVWAANNLIQGPFKHTVAVHLFMITNFIYHAVPRAKRCPGAESRAVVRMFTVVDDAPKVVFLSKENLFVCVFDREQISRRATAACKCQRWCLIRRNYFGCVVDQRGKLADQLLRPSFFVYPGCKFSHTSTEEEAPKKLTGTNRLVTNNEKKKKKGELLADNQQIGFLENCVSAEPSNRHRH